MMMPILNNNNKKQEKEDDEEEEEEEEEDHKSISRSPHHEWHIAFSLLLALCLVAVRQIFGSIRM